MKTTKGPVRNVVGKEFSHDRRCRPGEGSYFFKLECGHVVRSKKSNGTPIRKHCIQCQMEPKKEETT